MEMQAANARYDELHEAQPFHDGTFASWSKDRSKSHPYHYRDGVSIWVSPVDLSPDDKFLTRKRSEPARGGESDRHQA